MLTLKPQWPSCRRITFWISSLKSSYLSILHKWHLGRDMFNLAQQLTPGRPSGAEEERRLTLRIHWGVQWFMSSAGGSAKTSEAQSEENPGDNYWVFPWKCNATVSWKLRQLSFSTAFLSLTEATKNFLWHIYARWRELLQFELCTSCSGRPAVEKFLCLQGHWCKCATQWKEPVAIKQISLPFPSKVSLSCPWLRLIEHKFPFIWILSINTKQFVSKLIAWLHFTTIQLSLNASVEKQCTKLRICGVRWRSKGCTHDFNCWLWLL